MHRIPNDIGFQPGTYDCVQHKSTRQDALRVDLKWNDFMLTAMYTMPGNNS